MPKPIPWSPEEERKLRDLHAQGLEWVQMDGLINGRSWNGCKERGKRIGLSKLTRWSDEELELFRNEMARNIPYAKIAKQLGRSKGSIAGLAKRMGLRASPRPSPPRAPSVPKIVLPPPPPPEPEIPATAPISLMQLTSRTCRWPLGDPLLPGFGFCGCRIPVGSVYCSPHKAESCYMSKPVAPRSAEGIARQRQAMLKRLAAGKGGYVQRLKTKSKAKVMLT